MILCDGNITVGLADVSELDDDALFCAGLERVSDFRYDKVMRFRFRADRNLCLGAGLLLDRLLDKYGLREKDMAYETNEYGKPRFRDFPGLHFNLSHSDRFVAAVIGNVEMGIDIEVIRPFDKDLARYILSDQELSYLLSLPDSEKPRAFTRLWTLKESILKARGISLERHLLPSIPIVDGNISPSLPGYSFEEHNTPDYCLSFCCLNT